MCSIIFQLKDKRTKRRLKKKWKSSPSVQQVFNYIPIKRQKDKTSLEKEMEKLTICGARALAAALDSDSIRVSLPRKLYYRKIIKMELTKKKGLTVSSPGTCLHKSSHQFHSVAHTGDSSLDLLVFFHHEELLSYLHCAH